MNAKTRRDFLKDVGAGVVAASVGSGLAGDLGFSTAFSMPDGLTGGRGGKPFRRRISSFSCWFSSFAAASTASKGSLASISEGRRNSGWARNPGLNPGRFP